MNKLFTQIVKSDNSSVVNLSVNITLEQIEEAQCLRYNSNEFNDWLPKQQLDIDAEEILHYIKQSAEVDDDNNWVHDFIGALEETKQNELPIMQFDIEDVGYVIMGFDKKLVTKEAKSVVKEIKGY